ncbi:unnamed protein product [Cylindrotheca closterium]|uniref:Uncharacterized protein n=1 Tax=Cylindrotheca closterium TaxID=2856 RepID=A0AAD2CNS2_9STRA|nr:unnamed protein product [Cylindrotheca closterium]
MTSSLPSFSSVQLPSSIKLQFPISNIAQAVRQVWWAFPLLLAAIPLYCVAQGTCPSMPHWWPVVSIQDIGAASSSSTPSLYRWVVSGFLSSNVWYFLSGGWLLSFSRSSGSQVGKFRPLGAWMLTAGLMSSIYHSVQAIIGVNAVTETLAYVDHGIALAAGCFYMDTCGLPSKRVWAIGLSGIACLATPNTPQAYAILHSIWHFLSAAAATLWAIEGHAGKINKQNEVRLERIMRLVHL